jgi:hypothetical protein
LTGKILSKRPARRTFVCPSLFQTLKLYSSRKNTASWTFFRYHNHVRTKANKLPFFVTVVCQHIQATVPYCGAVWASVSTVRRMFLVQTQIRILTPANISHFLFGPTHLRSLQTALQFHVSFQDGTFISILCSGT